MISNIGTNIAQWAWLAFTLVTIAWIYWLVTVSDNGATPLLSIK